MRESEATGIVALLMASYPRGDWPASTQNVYRAAVEPFTFGEARQAVERIVASRDFPPSIAEVRREIVESRLDLPSDVEAWELATRHAAARRPGAPKLRCIACAGERYTLDGDLCPDCDGTGERDELDLALLPPVVDPIPQAVRAVGGWSTIRSSERPEHLRRDFLDAYRRLRAETVERENFRMIGANGDHPIVDAAVRDAIEERAS